MTNHRLPNVRLDATNGKKPLRGSTTSLCYNAVKFPEHPC